MIQLSNPRSSTRHVAEPSVPRRRRSNLGGIRDAFAWHAAKVIADEVELIPSAEIEIESWPGREVYVVDFLVIAGGPRGRRIAVECAGSQSLRDHQRRRRRDARLVARGAVDAVYRINGSDPAGAINDALLIIAAWERLAGAARYAPDVFSSRGRFNLTLLASLEARETAVKSDMSAAMVRYRQSTNGAKRRRRVTRDGPPFLLVQRFDRRQPAAWSKIEPPSPRTLLSHTNLAA